MRRLKFMIYIVMMATLLSSCGAASSESVSTEPEEPIAESELSDTVQSPHTTDEEAEMHMTLKIGETSFTVDLENNESTAALMERLPMTITMDELHGNEKYFYLDDSLPTDSEVPDGIKIGDVMLYGADCLVVFYESFSTTYSYTPIGHITDIDGLKEALGSGSVSVEWIFES